MGQSGDANRDVTMTAGVLWWGRTEYPEPSFDTSGADTFITYSAGGQEDATASQWNNLQYDNAGTLTNLSNNNKWANLFFFLEPDGHVIMVYGRAEFNSEALADLEGVPSSSLPTRISETSILISRFTFQKSSNIATISSAFDQLFANAGVADHADLANLQGGVAGEYYHLTAAEIAILGNGGFILPTDYTGTDTQKIQQAADDASSTKSPMKILKKDLANTPWDIEDAITLGSNTTIYIEDAILKLTDTSRDNIFRSENCGVGIFSPYSVLENIHIIGTGTAQLEGADVPRASGDAGKNLHTTTDPGFTLSFGTDFGVGGQTQTGDWRNNMIMFAYVNNFSVTGINFVNPHCYSFSMERCTYGIIRDLLVDAPKTRTIPGYGTQYVNNNNLIDVRMGCNNIFASNLRGFSDDDPMAIILVDIGDTGGVFGEYQVTGNVYGSSNDDIFNISFQNMFLSTNAHHVRLLINDSAPGAKIYNIDVQNLTDNGDGNTGIALIKLGDDDPVYGGANDFGTLYNININNIKNNETDYTILVEGSITESNISNIIDNSSENADYPIHFQNSHIGCRNVQLSNIWKLNVASDLAAFMEGATPDLVSLKEESITIALSNNTDALSTGIGVENYRFTYPFKLVEVRGNVKVAGTTSSIIVDINKTGTGTIMTTNKIEIELTEKTSLDATTQPTLTTTDFIDDDELTFDIDSVDSGATGRGLKISLKGYRL